MHFHFGQEHVIFFIFYY